MQVIIAGGGIGRQRHLPSSRARATGPGDRHQDDAYAVQGLRPGDDRAVAQRRAIPSSDLPGALPHISAGKLRALAFTGATRMPQLPAFPPWPRPA
jgi:tripartite-type tricarboxylate transporter receptor subunit TctC